MKNIFLALTFFICTSAINANEIRGQSTDAAVYILNVSSVPLTLGNNTSTGAYCLWSYPDWKYTTCKTASGPISVPSGSAASPASVVQRKMLTGDSAGKTIPALEMYYPNWPGGEAPSRATGPTGLRYMPVGPDSYTPRYSGGQSGWKGYPTVTHKGKATPINGLGFWIFADTGVYRAHKDIIGFTNSPYR